MIVKLNLYLHFPFCKKKCNYCDFFSVLTEKKSLNLFLKSLKNEIFFWGEKLNHPKVATIYFGGGTPSILNSKQFQKIIRWLKKNFLFTKKTEFTLEANPESVTSEKIKIWKKSGVNRISLGIQSFSDKFLKILGRVHNSKKSILAIKSIKKDFKNFNIDLMFGLPEQTLEDFENDLKKAVSFKPAHISVYQLTPEPKTLLFKKIQKKEIKMPDDDQTFEMYRFAINFLKKQGYKHYEISNFCRGGQKCRHNWAIWHFEEYLGLGPGAYSFINNHRFANPKSIFWHCKQGERHFEKNKRLSKKLMAEFMFLGLRCLEGISFKSFEKKFKTKLNYVYKNQIEKLKKLKLIKITGKRIKLTQKGVFLGNEVFSEFI